MNQEKFKLYMTDIYFTIGIAFLFMYILFVYFHFHSQNIDDKTFVLTIPCIIVSIIPLLTYLALFTCDDGAEFGWVGKGYIKIIRSLIK